MSEATTADIKRKCEIFVDEVQDRVAKLVKTAEEMQAANPDLTELQAKPLLDELASYEILLMKLNGLLARFPESVSNDGDILTFHDYVSKLNTDKEFREQENFKAELGRIAQTKEKDRLMGLHKFGDGTLDYCILNAETMERQQRIDEMKDEEY